MKEVIVEITLSTDNRSFSIGCTSSNEKGFDACLRWLMDSAKTTRAELAQAENVTPITSRTEKEK